MCLFAGKKSTSSPILLWGYCKDMQTLFWVLWACLVTLTQIDGITLQKTSMFLCMQKINFIIHFFLMILHFKKSCNLIGLQHFWPITRDPKFCQICCWNIKNNISFHFRLFQRKQRRKNFQKNKKNLFWSHSGPFLPKFGQKWIFLEKKVLSVFQYLNYLPFLRKLLDGHTASFRVLRLIEKSCNLIGQEHFGSHLRNYNFPKYKSGSTILQLQ